MSLSPEAYLPRRQTRWSQSNRSVPTDTARPQPTDPPAATDTLAPTISTPIEKSTSISAPSSNPTISDGPTATDADSPVPTDMPTVPFTATPEPTDMPTAFTPRLYQLICQPYLSQTPEPMICQPYLSQRLYQLICQRTFHSHAWIRQASTLLFRLIRQATFTATPVPTDTPSATNTATPVPTDTPSATFSHVHANRGLPPLNTAAPCQYTPAPQLKPGAIQH